MSNQAAVELGELRWRGASQKKKAAHAKMMAEARWRKPKRRKKKAHRK